MPVNQWLKGATNKLSESSSTAQLDAEVMLAEVLKVDRSWIHSHNEDLLSEENIKLLDSYVERRSNHEPMAYILQKSEFYGREFYITNGVLVPRPESETIIELAKKYAESLSAEKLIIVDVGTGSGALAVTGSIEIQPSKTYAIDIDDKCLEVTKINAEKYNHNIEILKGDLLSPFSGIDLSQNDVIILANLPYVPENHIINTAATHEPSHAIFGGQDGLDLFRRMFEQIKDIKANSVTIITESLPNQHDGLKSVAEVNKLKQIHEEDFIQVFN